MSTAEEESETVTVETVNSVTLTQDTEGNLILHCPQDGIDLTVTKNQSQMRVELDILSNPGFVIRFLV